jgi:hypothetical protein
MKKIITLLILIYSFTQVNAQVVAERSVISSLGKDTLVASTVWASTVGQPVNDTYTAGSLTLTQGFNQPDGYSYTPYIPFVKNIVIYPNPVKRNSVLRFYLKVDKPNLTINIYNAVGQLIQSQMLKSYAGQTYHSLNASLTSTGTYEIRITVNDEQYVGRFIVAE